MITTTFELIVQSVYKRAKVTALKKNRFKIKFADQPTVLQLFEIGEALNTVAKALGKSGFWHIHGPNRSKSLNWTRREIWATAYNENLREHHFFIRDNCKETS